jgi:DNA-binding response OmpR family regulator
VLIVDDDRRSAATLERVLRAAGFDAASVRSGAATVPVLLHEQVAAVVVSFAGRGVAATTELVAMLRGRPEPSLGEAGIVVLVDDARDARLGLDAEADAVLLRPVDAVALADAVTDVAATDHEARRARRSAAIDPGSYFRLRAGLGVE